MIKREVEAKKLKRKKAPSIRATTIDMVPVVRYLENQDCFELKGKKYIDLVRVVSKDLEHVDDDEIEYAVMKFAKFYKVYPDDIKYISMNFPCNTDEQQSYLKHKIKGTKNLIIKQRLEMKLEQLEQVNKTVVEREFYIMFFAESLEAIYKNRNAIFQTLNSGYLKLVEPMSQEKKIKILFKMNNMASSILGGLHG